MRDEKKFIYQDIFIKSCFKFRETQELTLDEMQKRMADSVWLQASYHAGKLN